MTKSNAIPFRPLRRPTIPAPPRHLSDKSRRLWREIARAYVLEVHHLAHLQTALEALDRSEQARQTVEREGPYFTDKHGVTRPHPALTVQAACARIYQRAMRELNLDSPVSERK